MAWFGTASASTIASVNPTTYDPCGNDPFELPAIFNELANTVLPACLLLYVNILAKRSLLLGATEHSATGIDYFVAHAVGHERNPIRELRTVFE